MLAVRLLGGVLFAAALISSIVDVRHGLGTGAGVALTSFESLWLSFDAEGLARVQAFALRNAPVWVWGYLMQPLLLMPIALIGGLLGCLLLARGSRRRRPSAASPAGAHVGVAKRDPAQPGAPALASALASCRGAFVGIALFSGMSNLLLLTGSMFMLEVYDRVLPSRSIPTLIGLSILAAVLFMAQGGFDLIRGRLLNRVGATLDETLSPRVYDTMVHLPVRLGGRADSLQPLRDLDSVRSFLSGLGPTALFDLPWMPLYLAIIFAFHPLLGLTALAGAIVLVCLTALTEVLTRKPTKAAIEFAVSRQRLAESSRRNAEVMVAMGLTQRVGAQWRDANRNYIAAHQAASDVGGGLGAASRVLRLMLQSAVLGVGAYLVIIQEATAGIIIAGSILAARALAPVDLAIAHWKGFAAARQSWQRLSKLLAMMPTAGDTMALPVPANTLSVENISIVPPGEQKFVVTDITFALNRGQGLGIIGPSASGKSCLARALVGAWLPARGKIRLDGAALDQWDAAALGRHVGYLPQDVELFAGTVAQNISRFDDQADPERIVRAARAADVHELIVRLPNGYNTQIGEQGASLSAGQRQRIGLARALYGDPFLVVLDEPDANLDSEGMLALTQAILSVRTRGGIVIVIAHRHNVLSNVDLLLAMNVGRALAAGPKDAVMKKLRLAAPGMEPLKVVAEAGRSG
jgi:ATP-binding cassette subfamily C protein